MTRQPMGVVLPQNSLHEIGWKKKLYYPAKKYIYMYVEKWPNHLTCFGSEINKIMFTSLNIE